MSSSDIPITEMAKQILVGEFLFETVRRGYDPVQVHNSLAGIAKQMDHLEDELRKARAKVEATLVAQPERAASASLVDLDAEIGNRIARLMASAEKAATDLVDDAMAEAARILDETGIEADRLRTEATSYSEETRQGDRDALEEAQLKAGHIFADLSKHLKEFVAQAQAMRSKLLEAAVDLGDILADLFQSSSPQGDAADLRRVLEERAESVHLPELTMVEPVQDDTDPRSV